MSWFKVLRTEEASTAFGTEEGVQIGMEDDRYFEECCEEARITYIRKTPMNKYTQENAQLDCDEFRLFLEKGIVIKNGTTVLNSYLQDIVKEWDECEETRHAHRRDNV